MLSHNIDDVKRAYQQRLDEHRLDIYTWSYKITTN